MRYLIFKIEKHVSYLITIGSPGKADSQFRERVQSDIDEAMSTFSREMGATHSLAIVTDWDTAERGESTIPELSPGGQYLIFALFSSEEGSGEIGREELLENQRELERALKSLLGESNTSDISIGLVLLGDCSVKLIPVYAPSGPGFQKGWIERYDSNYWLKR